MDMCFFLSPLNSIDVDKLLGDPIQKKIETDSGLKDTIESVFTICAGL